MSLKFLPMLLQRQMPATVSFRNLFMDISYIHLHHHLAAEAAAAVVLRRTRLTSISTDLEVLVFTLLYICLSTLQSDPCKWWSKNFTFWKMFTMLFMQVLEEEMCINSGGCLSLSPPPSGSRSSRSSGTPSHSFNFYLPGFGGVGFKSSLHLFVNFSIRPLWVVK